MKNVTRRTSNPFGMEPPCPSSGGAGPDAVFGYGDANADVHVVGDHPQVHGGRESGVPFTGTERGRRLLDLLETVGLAESTEPDADGGPTLSNCFLSYLYCCCRCAGPAPTDAEYDAFEPFFDAELRAIGAHVLVPVGQRATSHVLAEYTARDPDQDVRTLHATELYGSGFLVVPLWDPAEWVDADREAAVETMATVLASDYTQHADLGRFIPGGDPYFVR